MFKQFYKSLYSAKDMAVFRFQNIWRSVFFVLFLSFIGSVPTIIQVDALFREEVANIRGMIINELPEFAIENGILIAEDTTPIVKFSPTFSFVFDPEVTRVNRSFTSSSSYVALLKDRVVIQTGASEQSFTYNAIGASDIGKDDVVSSLEMLDRLRPLFTGVIILTSFFISSLINFLTVTIFAYLATIFGRTGGRSLTYKQGWNIIACTLTIPTLFFFITDMLQINISYASSIQTFTIFVLLFLVIREIPSIKGEGR